MRSKFCALNTFLVSSHLPYYFTTLSLYLLHTTHKTLVMLCRLVHTYCFYFFLFLLDIVPFFPLILSILVCDSFFFFRSRSLIPAYVFYYLYFTHFYENMRRSSFQALPPSSQQHRTSNFSFIFQMIFISKSGRTVSSTSRFMRFQTIHYQVSKLLIVAVIHLKMHNKIVIK